MYTLILVSGVVAVSEHRKTAIALLLLSVAVIVLRWIEWTVPAASLPIVRDLTSLAALFVLAGAVAINVFAAGHALGDRIFGAIVLYLLIGLTWGVLYGMLERKMPGSFAYGKESGIADWIYFSFVTLTTVGYGDITPVARVARSLAVLEALIGQLYPAIIIARLVSLPDVKQGN
jgi:hypothetical protein